MKKIRVLFSLVAIAVMVGSTSDANASSVSGYISGIVQMNNRVFVYVRVSTGGSDTCGSSRSTMLFTIDPTIAEGRSFVSLALTAKSQGTDVYASGNSDCSTGNTPNGDVSESLAVLWLH